MPSNLYYSTAELVGAIKTIITPKRFFIDRYFVGAPRLSLKEEIVFDEILEGLPVMAPFVSPLTAAKPQARAGFQVKSFKPAYVKPLNALTPRDFVTRQAGEALFGELSPEQRRDDAVLDILQKQKGQIEARVEWMAANAIINGKVTVAGEDYPTQIVDFGRSNDNTIIISDPAQIWSNIDADIIGQLEKMSHNILMKTGYAGTDVIMSPESWTYFSKNKSVLAQADLRRGITNIPNLSPESASLGAVFKGQFGNFNIWVYSGTYIEQDGKIDRILQNNEIVMTCPPDTTGQGGVEGIKAYGAIMDVQSLVPTDVYCKMWEQNDPSVLNILSQSAPLPIPGRPNATLKAQVF